METMLSRIGYHSLTTHADGPMRQAGKDGSFAVMTRFCFEEDVSTLMPYINAVAENAELYERPPMVRFFYKGIFCAVYPGHCVASPMESRDHARAFADDMTAFLADILKRRDEISPNNTLFRPGAVPQILKLLPKTNCGDCGMRTCMAFAAMVAKQRVSPDLCPHMSRPLAQTYPVLDDQGRQVSQVTLHLDSRAVGHRTAESAKDDAGDDGSPEERPPGDGIPEPTVKIGDIMPDPLTRRELQVLALMGEGKTNPEISRTLNISPHTVKSHVIHIFNKLGVNHRTQAVVWAARQGII